MTPVVIFLSAECLPDEFVLNKEFTAVKWCCPGFSKGSQELRLLQGCYAKNLQAFLQPTRNPLGLPPQPRYHCAFSVLLGLWFGLIIGCVRSIVFLSRTMRSWVLSA